MDNQLPELKVNMLGRFSITYGEQPITFKRNSATKAVKLLQILLHSSLVEDRGSTGIPRAQLLDDLFGREELANVGNNLRVTVFRLRKMLIEAGLPEYEYIVKEKGVFYWRSPMKVDLDVARFMELAIYHGTSEDVLQTGIGHMNGTSLPIGGESTHSVLAAHRGLPAARLFTDIDQLKQGDMFYIHVLDETMAYQVDQILDMVDKDDHETLEEALQIQEGKDQVTLFTCTPYGVNSHRLLVRGTRVPYEGEEEVENTPVDSMLRAIQNYYMLYLILGLAVTLLVILIMKFLFDRKNKKRSGKTDDMSKEG